MRIAAFLFIATIFFTQHGAFGQEIIVKLPLDLVEPVNGRLLVMLSTDDSAEPRFQISDGPETQLIFGLDVENAAPGSSIVVDNAAFGYPIEHISHVPPGE